MLFDRWRFVLKLSIVWRGRYEQSKSVSSGWVRIKFRLMKCLMVGDFLGVVGYPILILDSRWCEGGWEYGAG